MSEAQNNILPYAKQIENNTSELHAHQIQYAKDQAEIRMDVAHIKEEMSTMKETDKEIREEQKTQTQLLIQLSQSNKGWKGLLDKLWTIIAALIIGAISYFATQALK